MVRAVVAQAVMAQTGMAARMTTGIAMLEQRAVVTVCCWNDVLLKWCAVEINAVNRRTDVRQEQLDDSVYLPGMVARDPTLESACCWNKCCK